MSVTVREVLDSIQFEKACPRVEVGEDELDTPVRWVFNSEREDVASFLFGGELLIVEGSSLVSDQGHEGNHLERYVVSLVDSHVSAVAVELVEGVQRMPPELLKAAKAYGMVLIGLYARVPFVDMCQSVNTMIVREQMQLHMRMDTLSTLLQESLAKTESVQEIADALAHLFGESVAIFDAEGLPVALSGSFFNDSDKTNLTVIIGLRERNRPIGTIELSSRGSQPLTTSVCQLIADIAAPVLSIHLDGGARLGMLAHLMSGPCNGLHVTPSEAADDHEMFNGLGYPSSSIVLPFAVRMHSLVTDMPCITAMIDEVASTEDIEVESLLEGDVLFGWMIAQDASHGVARFNARCRTALARMSIGNNLLVFTSRTALDCPTLIDGCAALRDILNDVDGLPVGKLHTVSETLLEHALSMSDVDMAAELVIARAMGMCVIDDNVLLETLCACFDNLGNRTNACDQLGIRRQTLYNRLDKVTLLTGVDQSDGKAWSMLLLAAKIADSWKHRDDDNQLT